MLKHMKHFLLPLLAGLFLFGCGKYVTQTELDTTVNSLRTDTDRSVLAVHECSETRSYAMRADLVCRIQQMQGAEPQSSLACVLDATWKQYCLRSDDEDKLTVPEPGVIDALNAVFQAAQQQSE